MNQFLKENMAIVAAIILPLALALVFALSTFSRTISVADPQHDFLVATNYYDPQNIAFTIDVVQNKLVIAYRPPEKDPGGYYRNSTLPRLWRVHVPQMAVEEITLRAADPKKAGEVSIPGITDVPVTNIMPGPDGYSFENSYYRSGNLMTEIFADNGSTGRTAAALVKDGRVVPIRVSQPSDWTYNSRFVGWITGEK